MLFCQIYGQPRLYDIPCRHSLLKMYPTLVIPPTFPLTFSSSIRQTFLVLTEMVQQLLIEI